MQRHKLQAPGHTNITPSTMPCCPTSTGTCRPHQHAHPSTWTYRHHLHVPAAGLCVRVCRAEHVASGTSSWGLECPCSALTTRLPSSHVRCYEALSLLHQLNPRLQPALASALKHVSEDQLKKVGGCTSGSLVYASDVYLLRAYRFDVLHARCSHHRSGGRPPGG